MDTTSTFQNSDALPSEDSGLPDIGFPDFGFPDFGLPDSRYLNLLKMTATIRRTRMVMMKIVITRFVAILDSVQVSGKGLDFGA